MDTLKMNVVMEKSVTGRWFVFHKESKQCYSWAIYLTELHEKSWIPFTCVLHLDGNAKCMQWGSNLFQYSKCFMTTFIFFVDKLLYIVYCVYFRNSHDWPNNDYYQVESESRVLSLVVLFMYVHWFGLWQSSLALSIVKLSLHACHSLHIHLSTKYGN